MVAAATGSKRRKCQLGKAHLLGIRPVWFSCPGQIPEKVFRKRSCRRGGAVAGKKRVLP